MIFCYYFYLINYFIAIAFSVSNTVEDVLSNAQVSTTCLVKTKVLLHDKSLCDQSIEIKDMSTMSNDDIMNYIQENKVSSEGDLELF